VERSRLTGIGPGDARQLSDEASIDVPRYLSALRRGAWLVALIVVPLTATVLVLSLVLPKTYSATSSLVLEDRDSTVSSSAETSTQRLATIRRLLTSRDVLEAAAAKLRGETADTLKKKVTASVDDVASIVEVKAEDGDAAGAAANANGVAEAFLASRRTAERRRLAKTRQDLGLALTRLRASGASADEIRAVRDRLSEVSLTEVTADELQVAESARPAKKADSPRPVQNTILAAFAALFLAVLAALGRDFMAPRVTGSRQFEGLTGLTPLAVLPSRRRRRQSQAAEAYQVLAASVRLELSESRRVVVITRAHAGDERAPVVAGLGRALTGSGVPTLLVSADLRHPMLHKELDVPPGPGVGEVLDRLERDPAESADELIAAATRAHERPGRGELRALPSGDPSQHPAALLSGAALGTMFSELGRSEYRYVVVEGPPLLGPIDGQLVARWADAVLVVCHLDRLSPDDATELGDVVARLDAPVLGAVLVGGTSVRYSLPLAVPAREPAGFP
jgi:Mrp family chromosome partitioning ATPase/capsular polysaccharide biosynthesis protein